MINDNTHRLQIPDGEVRELASPQGLLWERAVQEFAARLEQAYVTRNNGIKGLKAFGGAPVKHKAEKLWGRYVPAVASDTTTYPMALNGWKKAVLDGTESGWISAGNVGDVYRYQNSLSDSFSHLKASDSVLSSHFIYHASQNTDGIFRINDAHYAMFCRQNTTTLETFKAYLAQQYAKGTPVIILYPLANPTGDEPVWKFVKDIGSNGAGTDFGYYNDATNEFVKVAGASGSVIQPIAYAESTGTQYVDTGYVMTSDVVEYGISLIGKNSSTTSLFGSEVSATPQYSGVIYSNRLYLSGSTTTILTWADDKNDIVLKTTSATSGTLTNNGVDIPFTYSNGIQKIESIALFGNNKNGEVIQLSSIKVKHFYIKDNGILVRDLIPIRIGTTAYMLDLVEWKLYANAGTGTFTAGADIPYSQLCPDVIKVNTGDLAYGVGKNLFDITALAGSTTVSYSGNTITINGTNVDTGKTLKQLCPQMEVGKTYCLSMSNSSTTLYKYIWLRGGAVGGQWKPNQTRTITQDDLDGRVKMYCSVAGQTIVEMQIEEGSTATPYEPYAKTIRTNGTHKVIVGSQGVVDLGVDCTFGMQDIASHMFFAKIPNMKKAVSTPDRQTGFMLASDEYTIDTQVYITSSMHDRTMLRYVDELIIRDNRFDTITDMKNHLVGKYLFYQRTDDATFIPPVTRDIPMLLSADSFADVQTASKTEPWGIKVLDGTENWSIQSIINYSIKKTDLGSNSTVLPSGSTDIICSHYPTTQTDASGIGNMWVDVNYVNFVGDSSAMDLNAFKAYLASEYAKGTPVIILYPLATPATEQVTIAPIASARRTTYVADSESELGKLNLELKFLVLYNI